jgi:hypothetical protein
MNKVILRTSGSKREGIMSYLQQTIKAVIRPGDEVGYVAECLEIAVVKKPQRCIWRESSWRPLVCERSRPWC